MLGMTIKQTSNVSSVGLLVCAGEHTHAGKSSCVTGRL